MNVNSRRGTFIKDSDDEFESDAEYNDYEEEDEQDTDDEKIIHNELWDFKCKVVDQSAELDWGKAEDIFNKHRFLDQVSDSNGKNILHMLMDSYLEDTKKSESRSAIKTALINITARYPELLWRKGREVHKTPLYWAIEQAAVTKQSNKSKSKQTNKLAVLAEIFISHCDESKAHIAGKSKNEHPLSRAVSVRCGGAEAEENVLHRALREPYPRIKSKLLLKLVSMATPEAVTARDKLGRTPLYYAVHYERCSQSQLEIVKMLLRIGDSKAQEEGLTGVLDLFSDKGLSPYQHHIKTRDSYDWSEVEPTPMPPSRYKMSASKKHSRAAYGFEMIRRGSENTKNGLDQSVSEYAVSSRHEQKEGPGGRSRGYVAEQQAISSRDHSLAPDPYQDGGDDLETPETQDLAWLQGRPEYPGWDADPTAAKEFDAAESVVEKKRKRDKYSDMIKSELKMQYLRTRSAEKAIRFLYGDNPDGKGMIKTRGFAAHVY
jgi:hypothetical protein